MLLAVAGARGPALVLASMAGAAGLEAEDVDGETPLSLAAAHGGLRAALVALATGESDLAELLGEDR